MRILHLTDTHLGAWWSAADAPGRDPSIPAGWSRAADHHQSFVDALALADELDVDAVVHTGDVFDRSRPPWRWVQAAADALVDAARRRPVVVMPGNHDRHGLKRSLPLHVPDLHIVDVPGLVRLRCGGVQVRLACVPYRRDVAGWVHGATQALSSGADLLLAHQAFDGVRVPGLTFRVGRQRDTVGVEHVAAAGGLGAGVQAVLCGHIHPRQVVACGPLAVVHPGCTTHTAMRDRHHPEGVAVWQVDKPVTWRFIDRPVRALVVVLAPKDLPQVTPGALVQVRAQDDDARLQLEQAARRRGGWVLSVSRPPARDPSDRHRQLGLFS